MSDCPCNVPSPANEVSFNKLQGLMLTVEFLWPISL